MFLHTRSMTVSLHSRKAKAPKVAQFDSFRLCVSQGPLPPMLHGWGQRTLQSYRWTVPGASQSHRTPCQEGTFLAGKYRTLLLGKETALHVSRIPNWKFFGTPGARAAGEVAENNFIAACDLIVRPALIHDLGPGATLCKKNI